MIPSNSNQLVGFQAIIKDTLTISNYPRIATDAPGGHYRKPSMFFSVGGIVGQQGRRRPSSSASSSTIRDAGRCSASSAASRARRPCATTLAPTLDAQSQAGAQLRGQSRPTCWAPCPSSPPNAAGEIEPVAVPHARARKSASAAKTPEQAGRQLVKGATDILSRAAWAVTTARSIEARASYRGARSQSSSVAEALGRTTPRATCSCSRGSSAFSA